MTRCTELLSPIYFAPSSRFAAFRRPVLLSSPLCRFAAVLRLLPCFARRTRLSSTADSAPAHQRNGFSFRPTAESPSQLLLLVLVSICHLWRCSIACRSRVAARAFQTTSSTLLPRFHGHTCTQIAQSVVRYVQYLITSAWSVFDRIVCRRTCHPR